MARPQTSPAALLLTLLLLFAGSLVLRVRGIDWMLPHSVEPDVHLAVQVEGFRGHLQDWESGVDYGKYPHLLARLLQPFTGAARPEALDSDAQRAPLDVHLRRAMGTVLEVRYLMALLGALLVPLTYLLALRFMAPRGALVAAGLVAFSLLQQHYAQQGRPHVANAAFVLLAVLASLELRRRPTASSHALAGVALMFAVCSLHNGFAAVLPVAAAYFLAGRAETLGQRLLRPLLLVLPSLAGLRVFYPFFFEASREEGGGVLQVESGGLTQSGHSIEWSQFNGAGFGRVFGALQAFEPITLSLLAVALVALVFRARGPRGQAPGQARGHRAERGDLWIVLAYAVPYLFMIGLFSLTYQRFVVPLFPYLACFAAWGFTRLEGGLMARLGSSSRALVSAALLALILVPPGWATWRLGTLRGAPDNFERAAAWLAANTTPRAPRVLISHGSDVPLARGVEAVRADAALPHGVRPELWEAYQTALLEAAGPELPLFVGGHDLVHLPLRSRREARRLRRDLGPWLEELGAELLVLPVDEKGHDAVAWFLREHALREGELLARFSIEPDERYRTYPFSYATFEGFEAAPNFALRALRAEAVGPTVEIWRLRSTAQE